jgi:hypothetical protein
MSSLLLQPENAVPAVAAAPAVRCAPGGVSGKRAPMRRVALAVIPPRTAKPDSRRVIRLIASRAGALAEAPSMAPAASPVIANCAMRSAAAVTRAALAFFLSLKPSGATDDRHVKLHS